MGVREGDGTGSFWFSVPSTSYYLTKPLVSVLPRQRAQARLLLTCASLRRPLPSETNLIPSWLWEEAGGGEGCGRLCACKGEKRQSAERRGGAGASRRWLLLGGQQEGERGHSQVPSLEHILHVSAISPHHTDTHAGLQRHVLRAAGD